LFFFARFGAERPRPSARRIKIAEQIEHPQLAVRMDAVMSFMREAVGVLLAGGQGERLWPLTRDRAKPAVPFGGTYRIIDITLSNCINSGLRRVFVLTQYKALSLNRHLRRGWSGIMGLGDFIEILPPQMRVSTHWYRGTADAVYQNIYSIGSERSSYVVVLSGDHIYKMNYEKMLQQHVDSGAHATVASLEVSVEDAAFKFGVLETDKDWRVLRFEEKPANPARSRLHPDKVNASMGIYIFNTQLLIPILIADAEDPTSSHDFGHDILPKILEKYRVFAYNFEGAMSAHSTPMTKRTWTWFPSRRFLISTIKHGRCVLGSSNIRRRNLFSTIPTAWAPPSIRLFRPAA
jgi:ADP-glucose pyrophosphorylase